MLKKYGIVFLCAFALVLLAIPAFLAGTGTQPTVSFCIDNGTGTPVTVHAHQGETGEYYVFLPSYAQMEQVSYCSNGYRTVTVDGQTLADGTGCGQFQIGREYPLTTDINTTISFLKSANVATMYIDTRSGGVENLHRNQDEKESASVMLLGAEGALDCYDQAALINVRGNYTAEAYDKKPYLVTFSSRQDLLGMGAAAKWILLANSTDPTHMRSKIVFDLGKRVQAGWVPDCAYVDVYLNGHYNGLYLLTEKVEADPQRLDIDVSAGDFLCRVDYEYRWDDFNEPFLTNEGRTVEIISPKDMTGEQKQTIISQVNAMERSILYDPQLQNVDVDSFVCRYLIDEISGNIDADLGSSHFYCADGVFYAGPIWDYDITFGNNALNINPEAFLAMHYTKYGDHPSPYYSALYANELFYDRMTRIYQESFLPVLEQLMDEDIRKLSEQIAEAVKLNNFRWQPEEADPAVLTEELLSYIRDRVDFLSSAWVDGVEYCTVHFNLLGSGAYWNTSVVKGNSLGEYPARIGMLYDVNTMQWIDEKTGKAFDLTQPLQEDVFLTERTEMPQAALPQVEQPAQPAGFTATEYFALLSVLAMGVLLLCFAGVDIRRNRRSRIGNG